MLETLELLHCYLSITKKEQEHIEYRRFGLRNYLRCMRELTTLALQAVEDCSNVKTHPEVRFLLTLASNLENLLLYQWAAGLCTPQPQEAPDNMRSKGSCISVARRASP